MSLYIHQKKKFSFENLFSKPKLFNKILQICSIRLMKTLIVNFIFLAVLHFTLKYFCWHDEWQISENSI